MRFARFLRLALFFFPAMLLGGQLRRLYLDSCGPRTSWHADFFGPCSEAIAYLIMLVSLLAAVTILRYAAPKIYRFFFGTMGLFGRENGAGSEDPAPPRTP